MFTGIIQGQAKIVNILKDSNSFSFLTPFSTGIDNNNILHLLILLKGQNAHNSNDKWKVIF